MIVPDPLFGVSGMASQQHGIPTRKAHGNCLETMSLCRESVESTATARCAANECRGAGEERREGFSTIRVFVRTDLISPQLGHEAGQQAVRDGSLAVTPGAAHHPVFVLSVGIYRLFSIWAYNRPC
jgi:hypothetical protein